MIPLFDRHTCHIGWLDGRHLFDTDIQWQAFVAGGHVFSAATCEWLGRQAGVALLDRDGLVVAWHEGAPPRAGGRSPPPPRPPMPPRPFRPKRPIMPRRPLFPQTPPHEWSTLAWPRWLGLDLPAPEAEPDPPADDPAADASAPEATDP